MKYEFKVNEVSIMPRKKRVNYKVEGYDSETQYRLQQIIDKLQELIDLQRKGDDELNVKE